MKRVVNYLLVTLVGLSIFINNTSVTKAMDGDLTYEEGAIRDIETTEERTLREEKIASLNTRVETCAVTKMKLIDVPCFKQIEDYYCGPATVKQVLHYITGASKAQSVYANSLGTVEAGTNMEVIDDVLNAEIGSTVYVYDDAISDKSVWQSKIEASIDNEIPAVLDIDTRSVAEWPYSTSGHFLNVSGYHYYVIGNTYTYKIRVTDPYEKGLGNIEYNLDSVYQANVNHWRHAILW